MIRIRSLSEHLNGGKSDGRPTWVGKPEVNPMAAALAALSHLPEPMIEDDELARLRGQYRLAQQNLHAAETAADATRRAVDISRTLLKEFADRIVVREIQLGMRQALLSESDSIEEPWEHGG